MTDFDKLLNKLFSEGHKAGYLSVIYLNTYKNRWLKFFESLWYNQKEIVEAKAFTFTAEHHAEDFTEWVKENCYKLNNGQVVLKGIADKKLKDLDVEDYKVPEKESVN